MPDNQNLEDLQQSVKTIKREVDALQIALTSQNRPWYLDGSNLIAMLALLFSFGTTYVSYQRSQQQDVENLRSELRTLLQRIAELPKDNVEIISKYKNEPETISTLGGYINQENEFLAIQAAEIAKQLPPDKVSGVEYYAVALALGNSYKLDQERQFLDLTMAAAAGKDFNTEVACLRTNAVLLFTLGKPEEGRVEFQKALSVFSSYPGFDDYTQKTTNIFTEVSWAYVEASSRSPAYAEQHVLNAEALLKELPPGQGTEQSRAQIESARSRIMGLSGTNGPGGLPITTP